MSSERDAFLKANIGLVHACAKRFSSRHLEYDDLFQAGCIGLIKAYDKFDSERGVMFSTYAFPVILGEMKRLIREDGSIKVARSLKTLSLKASRETEKFILREGRSPTITEIAQILGVDTALAAQAVNSSGCLISLTSILDGSEKDIPCEGNEEQLSENISLKEALLLLQEKDRQLISLRYFKRKTQSETASLLGMTQVQVSRREKKILSSLRETLK